MGAEISGGLRGISNFQRETLKSLQVFHKWSYIRYKTLYAEGSFVLWFYLLAMEKLFQYQFVQNNASGYHAVVFKKLHIRGNFLNNFFSLLYIIYYIIHYILYITHYILYNIYNTLYIIHYILYITHYISYIIYYMRERCC